VVAVQRRVIDAFHLAANANNGLRIRREVEVRSADFVHQVEEFV
jgi:hypothetical protein